jgi:ADP-ribosyl-[dinitrogen reductase] hydrolase
MAEAFRTSDTHPLRIDACSLSVGQGYVGMTLCPGKHGESLDRLPPWKRDLDKDIRAIIDQGADGVLTVMEPGEMAELEVADLGGRIAARGLSWWRLEVPDGGVLHAGQHAQWDAMRRALASFILAGKNLVIHCRGGLGRTGTMAAALLMDLADMNPGEALARVRQARPGTVETPLQEAFIQNYRRNFPPLFEAGEGGPDVDRISACLLGGALGDALGYGVEFYTLSGILSAHGPDGVTGLTLDDAGLARFSDDTQMTLFTLEGVLHALAAGRPERSALRTEVWFSYRDWLDTQLGGEGPVAWTKSHLRSVPELHAGRAPGGTCLSALASGKCGTMDEPINDSKGCGGVMRVAPLGLVRCFTPEEALLFGADSAALTHGHPSGYWSAGAMAMMIRLLVDGQDLAGAAREAALALDSRPGARETQSFIETALSLARDAPDASPGTVERLGEGWVGEEALAIGLFAALRGRGFRDALRISATHSGDSDSTASITGQLVGARDGLAALPQDWIDRIELSALIRGLAGRLGRLNRLVSSAPSGQSR